MSKPRKPATGSIQKTPQAPRPKAPFERVRNDGKKSGDAGGREFRPAAHPEKKAVGVDRARPASDAKGLGTLINRRAADRLRAGHLWVYASDIESIEVPETGS